MEININIWTPENVCDWLKGLEGMQSQYIQAFANNGINGRKLLEIRPYELEELGIISVGHQEIILEAVENLKNFHYNLDKENLQFLSLQVSIISTSLHKQLSRDPESKLSTQILRDVTRAVSHVKTLIGWLDMSPFNGHTQYSEIRVQMLRLGLELATIAQRDRFVHNPIKQITDLAEKLSRFSLCIIQDITDPLILQPAYLDLVTLKKRESELGFYIQPSYQYIHRVTDIKYNSPAHNSGKVEDGDEIVQINYQTVVGWQYKKVLMQLQESATNVLLTLKKRPKHTKIYGHLGLIKLPSKKRSIPYRWDNLPSPRVELFHMPDLLIPPSYSFVAGVTKVIKQEILSDVEDSSGTESESPNEIKSSEKELRLYMPKPAMAVLQRRHTIAGDDLRNFQNVGNLVLWHNRRIDNKVFDVTSSSLRDKSVSFGFGLELTQRPTTCLGITGNLSANRLKTSLPSVSAKHTETIEECDEKQELQLNGVSKVVDSNKSLDYNQDPKYICNVDNTVIETFMPIPFADDEEIVTEALSQDNFLREVSRKLGNPPVPAPRSYVDTSSQSYVEAVNAIVVNREAVKRGRLDKSHSTPTYESDMPPAIEPRKQAAKIPPVPPRKSVATQSPFVKLPTEPETEEIKTKIANVIDLKSTMSVEHQVSSPVRRCPSPPVHVAHVEKAIKKPEVQEPIELVTPAKVKTMTSKKKNSLMAKRRKIPLKTLGTSTTIQGHLYRRAKDKTEVAYWAKLYFVLIETALYGFKNKEAQKADCVIFLSGFTVSLAKEVHSKQYAFKVYHPKKTFYLAAETSEALAQWIEYIRQATMKGKTNLDCQPRELFSETECSEDEFDMALTKHYQPPPSKHYHLNFGSLKKKFSNASITSGHSCENSSPSDKFLGFFSSNKSAEKKSADIIPTSAFKTYKKVKEHGGGLQLGATSMSSNSSVSDMYLLSGADNSSILSGFTIDSRKKVEEVIHDVIEDDFKQQEFVVPVMEEKPSRQIKPEEKPSRQHKPNKRPLNFLHASNPNLLDFNFQSEFPLQNSIMPITNWDHHTGMTLHDLMQKQLDEEKKDMYNKLVVLGIEKDDERALPKKSEKPAVPPKPAPVNPADPKVEKIQKRLLPVTPDYAQSFKPEDKAIQYTRSKEGQKLRDFGYELINSDDSTTKAVSENPMKVNEKLWNKRGDRVVPTGSLKKKSGFNWMMSHDKEELPAATSSLGSSGSFRKSKNKIDNKTPTSFATSPFSYEKSLQQGPKVLRKNSAPNSGSGSVIPYFSKLSFSSSVKEKKLLGSPKLHRAIFGSRTNSSSSSTVVDHEIFSPITFPKIPRQTDTAEVTPSFSTSNHQNYPSLQSQLPPTFKPEIYSLNSLKKTHSKND